MAKGAKAGKKKKKLAQQRYTNEERWIKNKRRKVQKYVNKWMRAVKIKIKGEWETIEPNK